jgi:hypothetical protein
MIRKQDIKPLFNVTCTVEELDDTGVWPTGKAGIYDAIRRGELDVLRSKKRLKIICAPLRKRLGIAETSTAK